MSLRARLLLTTIVLVALGLLAVDVATYRATSSFLVGRVDDQLVRSRDVLTASLQHGVPIEPPSGDTDRGSPLWPNGMYATIVQPDGTLTWHALGYGSQSAAPPALPGAFPASPDFVSPPQPFTMGSTGGDVSYRALAVGGQGRATLVVALPLTDVFQTLGRIVRVELAVTVVVLLALTLLALWLVRLGLRPLEGMGETAGAIAAGDLSRRVEPATEKTEVGRLGLALNAMLAQIERAFEERRRSEERLRRFAADASHELRTPLTSIRGYAELFRRGADTRPDDLAKAMRRIEDEAARMGVLVDDLLLLARLDQGRPIEREEVDLGRVAADAVDAARTVDPERPIDLAVDAPVEVAADAGRMRQVLDNLLDNARSHTPDGTPVHVRVAPADGLQVELSVQDEGPGLTPEAADRVFERFFRGDPARSRETGGVGLGLAIVSAIVEAHGGTVSAGRGTAGGARFAVLLPAWQALPPPPPEAAGS
ncbi:MAG: HAMP domain-containing sensor histidine kinase [Actinomycetota bacterium]